MSSSIFVPPVNPRPLGWIAPHLRTDDQKQAHEAAVKTFLPRLEIAPHKGISFKEPPKGVKVILTDAWKHPDVVADIGGKPFTGFGQYTGSCVGVSDGNAVTTLSCIQRLLSSGATKAMIAWWPFDYGRTRFNEGDRGQGEGAVDSVMAQTICREGVFDITQPGLPAFSKSDDDGYWLTQQLEMQWSDGGSSIFTKWMDIAKVHMVGSCAVLNNTDDIWNAVANGYPVLDGCNNYVGHGSVKGSGDNAYVVGQYDGRGGHSTCILAIWDHPADGKLFGYSNQWLTSTYPKDPAGLGRCCTWITESTMAQLFRNGGSGGETVALSHLNWFPAQPVWTGDWTPV